MDAMTRFLRTSNYSMVSGEWVPWSEFQRDFLASLRPAERSRWPEAAIRQALGEAIPVGRGPANVKIVGNLSRVRQQPRRFVRTGNLIRLESA